MAKKKAKKEVPVKASELIKALEGAEIDAEIVDEGDLAPVFRGVSVDVDDDHVCSVSGSYMYREDDARYGVDPGRSEAEVLGVVFSKPVMDAEENEIELSGKPVEYDGDLCEQDVLDAAEEAITFPGYDPDAYEFDPESVSDEDLASEIDGELWDGLFALNENGEVCLFDEGGSIPEDYTEITRDEAIEHFVENRDSIPFDLG